MGHLLRPNQGGHRRRLGALAVAGLALGACTSILGYGDIEVRDEGAAGRGATGGAAAGTATTTGGDGGTAGATTTGTAVAGAGGLGLSCGTGWRCVPVGSSERAVLVPTSESCPTGFQTVASLYAGIDPGCTACSCTPSGGQCNTATVRRYMATNCTNFREELTNLSDDTCVDVFESLSMYQALAYRVEIEPEVETCLPLGGAPRPLESTLTCASNAEPPGSCPSGYQCVPLVPDELGELCLLLEGDTSCPADFADRKTGYADAADGRFCECDCSAPTGAYCSGGVTLYASSDCDASGSPLVSLGSGYCASAAGYTSHDSFLVDTGTYVSGTCTPEATAGTVTFGQPATLCCSPP